MHETRTGFRQVTWMYLSGHISKKEGKPWTGKLGAELTTTEGKEAAKSVAIDLLGTLHAGVGTPPENTQPQKAA